jgi:hypothetical protein
MEETSNMFFIFIVKPQNGEPLGNLDTGVFL